MTARSSADGQWHTLEVVSERHPATEPSVSHYFDGARVSPPPTLLPMGGRGRVLALFVVPCVADPEPGQPRTAYPLTVKAGSRLAQWAKVAGFLWRDIAHVADYPPQADVIAHEAVHLWQCYRECGGSWLRYLWRYWRLRRQHGYDAHPWEVEARTLAPGMARQLAAAFDHDL